MSDPHIALFEPYKGGHHPQFVRQLLEYWVGNHLRGRLDVVVTDAFLKEHDDVADYIRKHRSAGLYAVPAPGSPHIRGAGSLPVLLRSDLEQGRLLKRYLREHRPDHVVMMYFDHLQFSLFLDLRLPYPVTFSGIYFRPSFHYGWLSGRPGGWKERVQQVRKRFVLGRALANPHFKSLLSLDPYVGPFLRDVEDRAEVVALPDGAPIEPAPDAKTGRIRAGRIDPERHMALMFGVLDSRKGVPKVLEAAASLAPALQQRLALYLAGSVASGERAEILYGVNRLREQTEIQVILEDRFVPDEQVHVLVHDADFVILAYQQHVGSSNVLVRTASQKTPVIGSDYGIVGEHIRRHRLGMAVDTHSVAALAKGLERALTDGFDGFDASSARAFAEANSAEAYARTVFRHAGVPVHHPTPGPEPEGAG